MSWPSCDKPPWKNVKWSTTDSQLNPPLVPKPEWSLIYSFPQLNGDLYSLKRQIETLDLSGQWEFLKRSSNPYELVFSQSQDTRIPPSVCSLRPLSRSFFKMVEMLTIMNFFKRHKSIIRSAHVCEGPGGFIEALSYLSTKNSSTLEHSWAITLKPSKSNIPGWKRAYNFLKRAPMVHIEYGADGTGDIMVPINQAAFLEKARGKCHIYTADGGFDFSENYLTQEEEVFPLLVASSLIGLQTLVIGGDFILKVFDTELKSTKDLLALLSLCFDSWTLYKPSLSRPCNAEKYFLGKGCRQIPNWVIHALSSIHTTYITTNMSIRSIFPSIPQSINISIEELQKAYLDQQVVALNYAMLNNEEWNKNPEIVWKSIRDYSLKWCNEFKMPIRETWF